MTLLSILLSTTAGKIILGIIIAAFVGIFIYTCKYNGFWRAVLKFIVALLIIAAVYIAVYYILLKTNAPFMLLPLF